MQDYLSSFIERLMMKRFLSATIYSLALFLLVLEPVQAQNQRLKRAAGALLVDGVALYNEAQYKSAREVFSAVTDSDPMNDAAYYYMGMCDFYIGDAKAAEAELREAVSLDPTNFWYRERLAALYASTGQTDLTVSTYEDLLRDYPKKTDLYYSLVNLYARQGNAGKVLETLDTIEALVGKDESVTLARYDVLMRTGHQQEAFKALQEYNELFSSPEILSVMGDTMLSEDKDSLAVEYYREALRENPVYAPAMLGISEIYRMNGSYDEYFESMQEFIHSSEILPSAKCQYLTNVFQRSDRQFLVSRKDDIDSLVEGCLSTHPRDTSVLSFAGSYYYSTERVERAAELFRTNSDLHPESFSATATLVQMLMDAQRWDELALACETAYSRFPSEPAFLQMISAAHYNTGDYQAVISDSERMIAAFPSDSAAVLSALSSIGDMYHQLGDEKRAFKTYDKALKINPAYAPVLNNYAYFLSVKGRKLAKAYKMSKITVEQEPDNATYLDTFGWILYLQGMALEAKPFFKHAMLYGGKDSATMLDHYAEVLFRLGEYDQAKLYWKQALEHEDASEIPDLESRYKARMEALDK